jgi:hypothetical protein
MGRAGFVPKLWEHGWGKDDYMEREDIVTVALEEAKPSWELPRLEFVRKSNDHICFLGTQKFGSRDIGKLVADLHESKDRESLIKSRFNYAFQPKLNKIPPCIVFNLIYDGLKDIGAKFDLPNPMLE